MYFTYEKTVRFAGKYDYDIQELFDFIIDIFTPEDIKDIISDGYNTPKDVITVILRQSKLGEIIIDRFLQDEEDDLIYNIDNEEVEKQVASVLEMQLINYYTEHWNEFSNS